MATSGNVEGRLMVSGIDVRGASEKEVGLKEICNEILILVCVYRKSISMHCPQPLTLSCYEIVVIFGQFPKYLLAQFYSTRTSKFFKVGGM